jgi:hypothetical protein
MAGFLPSWYNLFWVLYVSRYKADWEQVICPLIVILLTALAGSAPVSKRSGDRGRRVYHPAVSCLEGREAFAKNMTSLFTLPSVLEVSCAIWGMSWEQRRQACEASGCGLLDFRASRIIFLFLISIWIMVNSLEFTKYELVRKMSRKESQVFLRNYT